MANEKLFFVGFKALIANSENKFMLMEEDVSDHTIKTDPYWDMPGGRIQKGEDAEAALKREVEEETGITELTSTSFFTAVISNHEIKVADDERAGLLLMIYKVSVPEDSKIRLSEEHTAYEWVDATEAAKRLSHKYPKEFTDLLLQGDA